MSALLQLLRWMRQALAASFQRQPRWHRCPVCSMYLRDGIATTAQPEPDAWVESEPRICAPCRHEFLCIREGRE